MYSWLGVTHRIAQHSIDPPYTSRIPISLNLTWPTAFYVQSHLAGLLHRWRCSPVAWLPVVVISIYFIHERVLKEVREEEEEIVVALSFVQSHPAAKMPFFLCCSNKMLERASLIIISEKLHFG